MKSLRQGYGGKTPIVPHCEAEKAQAGEEPKATITAEEKRLEAAVSAAQSA